MAWSDNSNRTGHDPWEMQSRVEADRKVNEIESRRPSLGPSAADARSIRAWAPLLVVLAIGAALLVLLSLPG